MSKQLTRAIAAAAVSAAVLALATVPAMPAALASPARPAALAQRQESAVPAARLKCHAWMTSSRPRDYTSTGVVVRTAGRARVTTIAHYRTVNHKKSRQANAAGHVTIRYYISGATPGFRVVVSVYVSRSGRKGSCSTSFRPRA